MLLWIYAKLAHSLDGKRRVAGLLLSANDQNNAAQRTLRTHGVAERCSSSSRLLRLDSFGLWVYREGSFRWTCEEEMEATSNFLSCLPSPWQALKAPWVEQRRQGIVQYSTQTKDPGSKYLL